MGELKPDVDLQALNEWFADIPPGPYDALNTTGGWEVRQIDTDPANKHHWPFRLCSSITGQTAGCDAAVFSFIAGVINAWPHLLDADRTEGRGEPVAWAMFQPDGSVLKVQEEPFHEGFARMMAVDSGCRVHPLYASPIREPEISRTALIETMRQHIKADAVGLAPAVIAHYLVGFEEAADAILNLAPVGGRGEEAGWLIERQDLAPYPLYMRHTRRGHSWTPDPNEAARFATKDEASAECCGGDESGPLKVTEHVWQPLPPPPQEHDNQWFVWSGDDQPVEDGVLVDVRFNRRCGGYGKEANGYPADFWDWSHDGTADPVIIEWRISPPEISADDGASSRHTGQLRDEQNPSINEESQTNGS